MPRLSEPREAEEPCWPIERVEMVRSGGRWVQRQRSQQSQGDIRSAFVSLVLLGHSGYCSIVFVGKSQSVAKLLFKRIDWRRGQQDKVPRTIKNLVARLELR